MFEKLKTIIKQVLNKLASFGPQENASVSISDKMAKAIDLWSQMYANNAPWLSDRVSSMNLAADIASEHAKLVTLELETNVTGNDYLDEQYQRAIKNLRQDFEIGCATGSMVFKPYVDGDKIGVTVVSGDMVFPIAFRNDQLIDVVFPDFKTVGDNLYTRVERHKIDAQGYHIYNKVYLNRNANRNGGIMGGNGIGSEVSLAEVDEWAGLLPEVLINHVDKPLFGFFKVPMANQVEKTSPLGVSIFSRAVESIEQADKQWSRILWEYEGSELAVHADISAFKKDEKGKFIMPGGNNRLYRKMDFDGASKLIETFSPEIRDTSLFNGLNNILKRIEFDCGLAYGTLSDPGNVDKTATEIKASKQRSYQTVSDEQKALQQALEDLVYAMVKVGQIAGLPVSDAYEMTFAWDDSIIVDKESELAGMQADVAAGILRPELYIAKKYGVTEEEALSMMPQLEKLYGGNGLGNDE